MTISISAAKFWGSLFCGKRSSERAGCAECEGGRGTDGAINKNRSSRRQGGGMVDLNISQVHFPPAPTALRLTSFLTDAS